MWRRDKGQSIWVQSGTARARLGAAADWCVEGAALRVSEATSESAFRAALVLLKQVSPTLAMVTGQ